MVAGIVRVPLSFTPENARSPIRFILEPKKVALNVVSLNAVLESNADAMISTTLWALAEFPLPL
jgi:hypothetical protein